MEIAGETLTPRKHIVAAPYALNSQTLDGTDSEGFLSSTGDTASGAYDFSSVNFLGASPFLFEGSSANDFEKPFAFTDPTADRTITFQNSSGTVAFTSDIPSVPGGASLWEIGTNGSYEDDAAVIIGADTAFTYANGGVGDMRIVDQLEVLDDVFIDNDLIVGASTSVTEKIGRAHV